MVTSALETDQLKQVTTLHKDAITAIQALLYQKNVSGHKALAKLVLRNLNQRYTLLQQADPDSVTPTAIVTGRG